MPTTASSSTSEPSPALSRRPLTGALGAVAVGAVLALLLSLLAGPWARQMLFDAWQRTLPRAIGNDVTVVMIDDPAVREVGPWPWPRSRLAQLVLSIAQHKPKAIAFDVLFTEPDRFNPDGIQHAYPDIDPAIKAGIGRLPTLDSQFAGVIGQAPVLLARSGISAQAFGVKGAAAAQLLVDPEMAGKPPVRAFAWPRAVTNIPELDDVALAHAFLNAEPDADGVFRRVPIAMMIGDRAMPGMAAELARMKAGAERIAWKGMVATIGPITLRSDETGTLPLRFGKFPETHIVSAAAAMAPDSPAAEFADKVVIIGLGTEGSVDLVKTPLERTFGVTVQAQAVDAMLHHGWLERPLWIELAEWALALVLVLLVIVAGQRRRWASAVAAGGGLLLMPLSWAVFTGPGLLFDPLRPIVIGFGAALAAGVRSFLAARAERTRLANELVARQMANAVQEGELQAARGIQLGMVPTSDLMAHLDPAIDAAAMLEPARSVGGDFFDAFRVDATRLLFIIADVTGKGVPAALFMAVSKTLAKSVLVREQGGLAHAVETLNAELLRESDDSMGVTMLVVLVDCSSGELVMVNAGHENPVLLRTDGAVEVVPMDGGPPFCVMDFPYPEERRTLAPGETLVLITDGVSEAQDEHGTLFGIEGALDWLKQADQSDPATLVSGMMRAVRAFEEPAEPADDLTVMAIRYNGPQAG
ncbi:CHASE2 domain-containing protein [Novosphingobium sp.]|uniref:CHASE2 domain-containing protein n=1 Tax=Novosphingobium sp. TaxID=1874826 RepID=UPI0025F14A66|nr:CHASE2 domain-containing protein [Novosphingobium sp.]